MPAKEELFKKVSDEVAAREKGMIVADTAPAGPGADPADSAQARRRRASKCAARSSDQVKPLGSDYGEAPVSVSFDCNIEQFVNFLSALAAQPEMLGTSDIRVSSSNPKDKRDLRPADGLRRGAQEIGSRRRKE